MSSINSLINLWDFQQFSFNESFIININDIFFDHFLNQKNNTDKVILKLDLPILRSNRFQNVSLFYGDNEIRNAIHYSVPSIEKSLKEFKEGLNLSLTIDTEEMTYSEYISAVYEYLFKKTSDRDICLSIERVYPNLTSEEYLIKACDILMSKFDVKQNLSNQKIYPIIKERVTKILSDPNNYQFLDGFLGKV